MKLIQRLSILSFLLIFAACGGSKSVTQKVPAQPGKLIENEQVRLQFEQAYLNAEREKALGRNDAAIRLYKEAIQVFPKSAAAHYNLAELYLSEGNPEIALNEINLALTEDQSNLYYFELKAMICHALTKHVEAAQAMEQVVRLNPGSPEAYFDAANEYIYAKDYKSALTIYDKMEERFGVGEDVIRQKQQLYLQLGKPDKAIIEVKKLLAEAPGETRYMGMLAELYWNVGKKMDAVELYGEILKKEPGNGYAHFGMAEFYRSENRKDEMLSELNEAFKDGRISSEPKMNVVFNLLPLLDQDHSLKKPVYQLAETITLTHPDEAPIHALMGDLYMADGKAEKAINEFEMAVNIDPGNLEVWKQYCSLLLEADSTDKLLNSANQALEVYPEQAILYYYKATAHRSLKEYDKVAATCKTGLSLFAPDDAINLQLYIMQGDAEHQLKNYEASDKAFDKALQIDPENSYVLNNYAYYLSLRKSNLEKALKMSGETLKQSPNDPSYLDTYGWILYQMGKAEEAGKHVGKALEKSPNDPDLLEHMGDILRAQNRKDEAMKYWKKALELKPDSETLKQKVNGTFKF